ncbi:MAG: zinc-binding protein [Clostridiaceae bacterium]|jgi:CxxC-x17-CxxC domain-containing protein|nr:zinc-binding protein [Clostridiaceae bacterium]
MPDKNIVCKDCGATFAFTENEQAFYREKGFDNEPQRCPACRAARKQSRNGGQGRGDYQQRGGDREMFAAICSECGRETMVPFKPSGNKPVYCRDCYRFKTR